MNHASTPLLSGLYSYATKEMTCFDVPGHKQGHYLEELKEMWGDLVLRMDVNASPSVDNLSHPTGIILQAEQLLADAYGSDHAFMLVNGSTSGVQYMIMSALNAGDKIILPRNVHKSAINALILAGAKPIFVEPTIDYAHGIVNGVDVTTIAHALDLHHDVRAVFLIHPTYFGATSALAQIISLCHGKNIPVLVDQAHGAHFGFHPDLPPSATKLGADLVTTSMHKTGGALTQASALFHNEGLIPKQKVLSTIHLFQTTSASYLLLASIDLARKKLMLEGEKRLEKLLQLTKQASVQLNALAGIHCVQPTQDNQLDTSGFDHLKLVISVKDLGISGHQVYQLLAKDYNLQLELGEPYVVLAIVSFGDTAASLGALVQAFTDISRRFYTHSTKQPPLPVATLKNPKMVVAPRDAFYHEKKLIPLDQSEGLICGESIMVYPPGIPLLIPGERITKQFITHYHYLYQEGSLILKDSEDPLQIQVLDKSQEDAMIDLWYSENHQEDTKFSIQVTAHLHAEQSEFQQIDFFKSNTFGTFFTLDGLMMVTEKDEFIYHDMITHIPMAVNPTASRILIIGGGDGGTAREILRYAHVSHVDMVEIDERVVRLCQKYLPQTACALDHDPRLTLHFADGLKFVQEAPAESYDLILVDSTDPIGPGEGLFTVEFYNNCKRILTADGILINQHESPYYASYAQEMKRAHSKIKETFPIAKVYQFHMPTYPSGHWLFGFASKKYDPINDLQADAWNALGLATRYYNTDLHIGAFMLPTYVRESLNHA